MLISNLNLTGLTEGKFSAIPHEVLEGGIEGIPEGFRRLQAGSVRGKKLVAQVSD